MKIELMNKQKGNAGLPIIVAVFLLVAGFFLLQPKTTLVTEKQEECYARDESKTVEFDPASNIPSTKEPKYGGIDITSTQQTYKDIFGSGGQKYKYVKIRGISSLVSEEFRYHMAKSRNPVNGRDAYIVLNYFDGVCEGQLDLSNNSPINCNEDKRDDLKKVPAPVNYRKETSLGKYELDKDAFKLLFIDYSDKVLDKRDGFVYVEIYLEEKTEVPEFVKKFCASSQPLNVKTIFQTEKGVYLPPFTIKQSDVGCLSNLIDNCNALKQDIGGDIYNLFVYEKIDSPVGQIHYSPGSGNSGAFVETNDKSKRYEIRFVSLAHLLALISEDEGLIYIYSKYVKEHDILSPSITAYKTLQLRTLDKSMLDPWGWWSPECKPAIYLYPDKQTKVAVKVNPKGYLTYTDPKYPANGWEVMVEADGKITTENKNYDYLYYESKIRDSEINKPKEGFVIAFNQLPQFYSNLLPKLGLSEKETLDFKEYWEKVLPYSPYYFIGLMKEKDIEQIEPLTIDPKPDTIIRVRLYFEALNTLISIQRPKIITPEKKGFTIVEWGGLVRVDKNHPFTCSQ